MLGRSRSTTLSLDATISQRCSWSPANRNRGLVQDVCVVLRELLPLHADPSGFLFTNRYTAARSTRENGRVNTGGGAYVPSASARAPFYNTRHTFISLALTKGANLKFLAEYAEYYGTSVDMIEKHYGRFV